MIVHVAPEDFYYNPLLIETPLFFFFQNINQNSIKQY